MVTISARTGLRLTGASTRAGVRLMRPPAQAGTRLAGAGLRVAAAPARHGVRLATAPVRGLEPRRRTVWRYRGRLHVELRHAHLPGAEDQAEALAGAVRAHPAVSWAVVNAALGRLVVAVDGHVPDADLLKIVEELDQAAEVVEPPDQGRPSPALMVGVDLLGLMTSSVEWVTRRAPFPAEVAGLTAFVETVPRLRRAAAGVVPVRWTPVANALAQSLAPGGTGLTVDLFQRIWQWREMSAVGRLMAAAEPALAGSPESAKAPAISLDRPRPLPPGPVERSGDQSMAMALAGGALGAVMTRSARRGLQTGLAALPRGAALGRETFAAELAVRLARRRVLVLDHQALRRLDRLDTVVLDAELLLAGEPSIGDVAVLEGASEREVAERVYALFDAAGPDEVRHADGWSLGPVDRVLDRPQDPPEELAGRTLLALAEDGTARAFVAVSRSPVEGHNALVVAARRAGLRLVAAGAGLDAADDTVAGGAELVESLRRLQDDGAGVVLVSTSGAALAAADVGIGVAVAESTPPWGADLLVLDELADAASIIEAVGEARRVSELGVTLARSGSGVAALFALTAPPGKAAKRALAAVNAAAGGSLIQGVWRARDVLRRPPAPHVPTTPWHAMPAAVVLDRLDSSAEGLTADEARSRRRNGGQDRAERWPLARAVGQELANPLTPVLAAGAAGSAAVGSIADAALVASAIGMSGLIGGIQRRITDKALAQMPLRASAPVTVVRDGAEREVEAADLVAGDIVLLSHGEQVPADCRLLEAQGLELDESALTGESLPTAKNPDPTLARHIADRTSMIYEGTTVAAGECRAVVVAVGAATESGRALAASADRAPTHGVEARLKQITNATTPLAVGAALGVTTSGLIRGGNLRLALSEGVNLAVASVPEGLPLLVSAAQLAATRRLAERGVHVRDPRTIETLGRVDVLCFDKTGTLTEGEIKLARVADLHDDASPDDLTGSLRDVLTAAVRATPEADEGALPHLTDEAVARGAADAGVGRAWEPVAELPFEPSRSYHAALGQAGGETLVCVKGAPEVVLPRCSSGPDGELDEAARRSITDRVERLAASGHRVLAVAVRTVRADRRRLGDKDVRKLTFLGLLGLADVVRDNAPPAVAALRDAGVHIVMLTGDHPITAGAIAETIGAGGDRHVITGDEIDGLDDDALAKALADVEVVARCTPAHKVRVVQGFQALGRTVAMTGDGANDAAGIRLADVGIALGGRGTPAAQAAADLVVADDRLETIVAALVEGRAMWGSVREALAILVGGNLGEISFTLLGSLISGRAPLNARQMMLMNMLTDLAPALAIAVRRPTEEVSAALLGEGPESSLGSALTTDIAQRAVVTTLGAAAGWTAGRFTGPAARARTIGLISLIGTQLAQTMLLARYDRGVALSALGSAVLLTAIVQTPVVSAFFGCVPLDPIGWATAVGAITAAMAASRFLPRPGPEER